MIEPWEIAMLLDDEDNTEVSERTTVYVSVPPRKNGFFAEIWKYNTKNKQ